MDNCNYFALLNAVNVSEHIEKKGAFSYLSWPFAVAQLRLADPAATWEVKRFDNLPYLKTDCGYFVEVAVTVQGVTLSQIHPVLDGKNRPILEPDAFDINTSIQRALVKAIALHGLGLYIYGGEDLPDGAPKAEKPKAPVTQLPAGKPASPAQIRFIERLIEETGSDLAKLLTYFKITALSELTSQAAKRRRTLRRDLDAVRKRYFGGRIPPSSQRGKRGTGSWAPSAVREILYRERYTGKVPYGETIVERPELRIVDAELWQRAQLRLKEVAAAYIRDGGHWWGRPSQEKYLLTGMGLCSCCGKSITALGGYNGSPPHRQKVYYYGCSYNHTRGSTVCANDHRARMEWLDSGVIEAIERQVLLPEAIAYTVEKAAEIVERELRKNPDKPQQIEAEARKLRKELDRFLRLISEGKAPESVLIEIKRREERLKELEREQATLADAPPAWTVAEIRAMCGERLRRFPELLHGNVPVARQALRKLLPEPLRIAPDTIEGRRTLRFEGVTTLGSLFDPTYKGLASPRGFEPRLPP